MFPPPFMYKDLITYSYAGLGGDNNLVLAIGSYGPNRPATENVQCRGQIEQESLGAFRKLISELPIDQTPTIFGPEADPRSSVKLPRTLSSGKS